MKLIVKMLFILLLLPVLVCADEYLIDDCSSGYNELLPVQSPLEDWVICKTTNSTQRLSGNVVSAGGVDYLSVGYHGDYSGWKFGRLMDGKNAVSIKFRIKCDKTSLPVTCQFWDSYARLDMGGWCDGRAYSKSFTIGKTWATVTLTLSSFTQTSGDTLAISQADLKAMVLIFDSTSYATIDIDQVTVEVSESDYARRVREYAQKECDYRDYDLDILEMRNFTVSSLRAELATLENSIAGISTVGQADQLKIDLDDIAGRIDNLRRVYLLECRLDAINSWLGFLNNSQYNSDYASLVSQVSQIRNDTSIPGYAQLDTDINALWELVWADTKVLDISWSVQNGHLTREDGLVVSLYGNNDQMLTYGNGEMVSWYKHRLKDDYARIADLGWKTIRFPIRHEILEPTEGQYNQQYIDFIKDCTEMAAEYGLKVMISACHLMHPDWFEEGPAGYESPTGKTGRQNGYAHLDAMKNLHQKIATELGGYPNVIGQEVPWNEPILVGCYKSYVPQDLNDATIATFPWLMENWNQYLKTKYVTISNLASAWQPDFADAVETGLGAGEHWDTNTILPPGARGETEEVCTRLGDFLDWATFLHAYTCDELSKAIKQVRPNMLTLQQQMLGGDMHSGSPIPIEFAWLQQISYDSIDIMAAHYELGWAKHTLPATGKFWYDGEADTRGGWQGICDNVMRRHGGFLAWSYCSIPENPASGLRCIDSNGRLKTDRLYLQLDSELYTNAHNLTPIERKVAIVYNTRLGALQEPEYGELVDILGALGEEFDTVGSSFLVYEPAVLDRYDSFICSTQYLDSAVLDVIGTANKRFMFYGGFERDISARSYSYAIDSELQQNFGLTCAQVNNASELIEAKALFCPWELSSSSSSDRTLVADFLAGEYDNYVGPPSPADFNGDGIVDVKDLAVLISDWLNCTEQGNPVCYPD